MGLQLTGSIVGLGSITASAGFFATASYATTASQLLEEVVFETGSILITGSLSGSRTIRFDKGDGTFFYQALQMGPFAENVSMSLDTTESLAILNNLGNSISESLSKFGKVKTINTNTGSGTNIAISLSTVQVGISSSNNFPPSGAEGSVYVVAGETGSEVGQNGKTYIYSTASIEWLEITPDSEPINDLRYVQISGSSMTGSLILASSAPPLSESAASKGYVDSQLGSNNVQAVTASVTASGWNYSLIIDNSTSSIDITLPPVAASNRGQEIDLMIEINPAISNITLSAESINGTINGVSGSGGKVAKALITGSDTTGYVFAKVMGINDNDYYISTLSDVTI